MHRMSEKLHLDTPNPLHAVDLFPSQSDPFSPTAVVSKVCATSGRVEYLQRLRHKVITKLGLKGVRFCLPVGFLSCYLGGKYRRLELFRRSISATAINASRSPMRVFHLLKKGRRNSSNLMHACPKYKTTSHNDVADPRHHHYQPMS
jgi:hypothetical protein